MQFVRKKIAGRKRKLDPFCSNNEIVLFALIDSLPLTQPCRLHIISDREVFDLCTYCYVLLVFCSYYLIKHTATLLQIFVSFCVLCMYFSFPFDEPT